MAAGPDDDTIRLKRSAVLAQGAPRRGPWPWIAAAAALTVASGLGVWSFAGGGKPDPAPISAAQPAPPPAEPAVTQAAVTVPMPPPPEAAPHADPGLALTAPVSVGDEAAILASRTGAISIFRLQPAPDILVLVFPSLHEQGRMLNRVGGMVEKAGLPHDRVSSEAAMDYAITQSRSTPDTYYSGHDYRTADVRRFFALAHAEGVALRPEEQWLSVLLDREEAGAVVSLTEDLDEPARATILRHELSHGLYFTSPAYAGYAKRFWQHAMSEDDRAHFREFLASQDYDPADEDLMLNETQAYLVHTADRRFFNAAAVRMTDAKVARLRAEFVRDMPPGWLRDRTPGAPGAVMTPAALRAAPRPRRRQGCSVSRTTARPLSWPPCLRKVSAAACNAVT